MVSIAAVKERTMKLNPQFNSRFYGQLNDRFYDQLRDQLGNQIHDYLDDVQLWWKLRNWLRKLKNDET